MTPDDISGFLKDHMGSLDDVTKNAVFVVACLRNHEKYSYCWIYFVCDDIAYNLME